MFAALSRQADFTAPQTLTGILALTLHAAYGAVRQGVNALWGVPRVLD